MSAAQTIRTDRLETRFELLRLDLANLKAQVAKLQSDLANQQLGGGGNSSGGGIVYFVNPVVISAGGNVTGQTIYVNIGGTQTATASTNATVYNEMASATVATSGKVIIVGPNPDGSYSVITQSC